MQSIKIFAGFEIPIHLFAKCEPELENASKIFKHLQKNANENIAGQLHKCNNMHV